MTDARKGEGLWQRILGASEERLGGLAEELLSNPHVAEALATAFRRAYQTKGQVDRNMQAVLSALNLPTKTDLNRLLGKLEALQGSLVNLNIKVDRLIAEREAERSQPQPPRPRRSGAKASHAGPAASGKRASGAAKAPGRA